MPSFTSVLLSTSALAAVALAKTDLSGCTSSQVVVNGGASLLYYVPGTGEICSFLDCGGGRAPPKTSVPGCAAYSGTATYSPSYLAGYGSMASSTGSATPSSVQSSSTPAVTSSSSSLSAAGYSSSGVVTSVITSSSKASSVSLAPGPVVPSGSSSSSSSSSSAAKPIGTGSGANGGVNGTVSTGSPSSSGPGFAASTGGAAKMFVSGAGLLALGGLVAAL